MECCTDVEVDTFEMKWIIKKFYLYGECSTFRDIEITSSTFPRGNDDGTKWHLHCEIKNISAKKLIDTYYQYTFFAVCDDLGGRKELWTRITSFFKTNDIDSSHRISQHNKITEAANSVQIYRYDINSSFLNKKNISTDQFEFICKFEMTNNIIAPIYECILSKRMGRNDGNYLAELLDNAKFSDITFLLGNEKLKAHKNILATRSPVFAAMFEHPMQEENKNEVVIDDIDVIVFKEMLRYIYTNETLNLKKMVMDLLYAADKYGLEDLKEKCGIFIFEKITIDNAAEALVFAYRHNIESLIELIEDFIKKHVFDVIETVAYENVEMDHPDMANIILRKSLEQFQL